VNLPTEPGINTFALPLEPDFTPPEVPTLIGLQLPSVPTLDIPLFDVADPVEPAAPGGQFAYGEAEYASELLTRVKTQLLEWVLGGPTGLAPAVEAAIWQRNRDRTQRLTERAVAEAARVVAGRGFSMPQGTMVRVIQQALSEGMAKDAEDSRAVMIQQAQMEQENLKFAFTTAITLEGALIQHYDQVRRARWTRPSSPSAAAIDIFNARVLLFQAQIQAFSAKAEVFKVRLQAALAQLEIFKAQIEAQKLVGDINEQAVKIYTARLDGLKAVAAVYSARIEGVKALIEGEKTKAEIYKTNVEAFGEVVKAKATEYQGYGERVKAEATKVQAYGEEVRAFAAQSDAFSALIGARTKAAELQLRVQEFPLEVYKSQIQGYAVAVGAEGDRLKSLASMFSSRVQAFAAGEQAKAAFTTAEVEAVKAASSVAVSQAQLAVQSGEVSLRAALSAAETAQASLRAAGQLAGQMASAAMAARNVSASISDSASNSASNSRQQRSTPPRTRPAPASRSTRATSSRTRIHKWPPPTNSTTSARPTSRISRLATPCATPRRATTPNCSGSTRGLPCGATTGTTAVCRSAWAARPRHLAASRRWRTRALALEREWRRRRQAAPAPRSCASPMLRRGRWASPFRSTSRLRAAGARRGQSHLAPGHHRCQRRHGRAAARCGQWRGRSCRAAGERRHVHASARGTAGGSSHRRGADRSRGRWTRTAPRPTWRCRVPKEQGAWARCWRARTWARTRLRRGRVRTRHRRRHRRWPGLLRRRQGDAVSVRPQPHRPPGAASRAAAIAVQVVPGANGSTVQVNPDGTSHAGEPAHGPNTGGATGSWAPDAGAGRGQINPPMATAAAAARRRGRGIRAWRAPTATQGAAAGAACRPTRWTAPCRSSGRAGRSPGPSRPRRA
jgi:hypothetical protein